MTDGSVMYRVTNPGGTHIYQDKNKTRKTGYADENAMFGVVDKYGGMLKAKAIWDVESGKHMDGWVDADDCTEVTDTGVPNEPPPDDILAIPTAADFISYRKVHAFYRWLHEG